MKPNTFNICPTCIHRDSCVITHDKSQVWSCSEYEEGATEAKNQHLVNNINKEKPEMVMA
ncbi:hypothetical protein [Marinirhabdus gelatinilytica]|uniref:Uncharacterized protein n=1 Tax=Marinirhabdus gelatinilytica TaxID=1703343 RepID=A0A370QLC5_9FLAO|nr:hypothetical protein [Marinirhabdus gelatinilytica]RDK89174.1 hypothetical protein C8D94_1011055 [Marinirhabdus gelatinilytica]